MYWHKVGKRNESTIPNMIFHGPGYLYCRRSILYANIWTFCGSSILICFKKFENKELILVRVGSWEAIPKPNKDEQHLSILWQIKQNNAASQTVADFKHSTGNQGYFRHPCMSSRNSDQHLRHLSSIGQQVVNTVDQ